MARDKGASLVRGRWRPALRTQGLRHPSPAVCLALNTTKARGVSVSVAGLASSAKLVYQF